MAIIDVDGDGALDADEYQRVSRNDRDQHDEVPDFEEVDTDGDEQIDDIELRALLLTSSPQFERLMLNRNRRGTKSRDSNSTPARPDRSRSQEPSKHDGTSR